jgi:hypothetical protein
VVGAEQVGLERPAPLGKDVVAGGRLAMMSGNDSQSGGRM